MKASIFFFKLFLISALTIPASAYTQSAEWNDLNKQVTSNYQNGQFDQALMVAKRILEIAQKEFDPYHPNVATSLYNLAFLLHSQGQYTEVESLLMRSLAIREKILGPRHLDVAQILDLLAEHYRIQGLYAKAEPLYMSSLAISEINLGDDNLHAAMVLNNLAVSQINQGSYELAEFHLKRSLQINENELGLDHPDVARVLNSFAALYLTRGQYPLAESTFKRSLAIFEILDPNHPDVAMTLNNLGELYRIQGRYALAKTLIERSLAIREKILRPGHPDVAVSLNNLAMLHRVQAKYPQAESAYNRALMINENAFGPNHPLVGKILNNLAVLFQIQGQYSQAESLYMRSQIAFENYFGSHHPIVATSLNNLGTLYQEQYLYKEAEPLFKRSLEILETILESKHPDIAQSLNNLAALYKEQGQHAKAEQLFKQSLAIYEINFGSNHPDVSSVLSNLSRISHDQGQYLQANALLKRSLEININTLGQNHPKVAMDLLNSSINTWSLGNMDESVELMYRGIAIRESHLGLFLVRGSEAEKRAFMNTTADDLNLAISLQQAIGPDNMAATQLALSILLQRKGRILDVISRDVAGLRQRLNEQDRALLDQLAETRNQQSSLYNQARQSEIKPDLYHSEMTRLITEAQTIEAKISSHSAEFRIKAQPITLKSVQQAVPRETALVEFAFYRPFNPTAQKVADEWGAAHYIAYVLQPHGKPLSVELGEAAVIDPMIIKLRDMLANKNSDNDKIKHLARQLDEQLMRPVRKLLGKTRTVFLSPDGELNHLPFGALVDENDKYLIENYAFTYLSSGRDLQRLQTKTKSQNPDVIIGNVDFGVAGHSIQTSVADSKASNRPSSTFVSSRWIPLPGTKMEALEIRKILGKAELLMGKEATEGALKKLNSPRILHVATHGFFRSGVQEMQRHPTKPQTLDGTTRMSVTENPLLRSGLVLANANRLESAGEDGVLTALETSGLNLWGTRLVVLSACETGLGDLQNGEGVFGLRRSLIIAGSESQLVTLWKVDDLATKDLMVDYYRRLVSKEGRSEALRQAQLAMLFNSGRQHPYFWASFIASGDWRQLN